MKQLHVHIFILGFLSLNLSCERKEEAPPQKRAITIAWIGPKSGPASIIGVDSLRAVQLALEEFHAKNPNVLFNFISEDDQYLSRNSITKYNMLVEEKQLNLLFLATYSAVHKISELAMKDRVIVVNPIDNDLKLSTTPENTFFIAKKTENLADLIANELVNESYKKTLILNYQDDDFMPMLGTRVYEQLTNRGLKAMILPYSRKTINFRPYLNEGRAFGADSFVILGYDEVGLAIKSARRMGFKKEPILTANLGFPVRNFAGDYAEGVYFTDFREEDSPSAAKEEFLKKFKERFHKKPDLLWTAFQSYDAVNLAMMGVNEYTPIEPREFSQKVKSHLLSVKNYKGLSGNISIQKNGTSQGILWSLYQWSNKEDPRRVLRLDLP